MNEQCGNCYYWLRRAGQNECRAALPVILGNEVRNMEGYWPITATVDWCGKWRGKEEDDREVIVPAVDMVAKLARQCHAADKLCEAARMFVGHQQTQGNVEAMVALDEAIDVYRGLRP